MDKPADKFFSLDDLWSVVGYGLLTAVNQLTRPPMAFAQVSLLASGMITIVWVASGGLRARNTQPNLRVAFWAVVAAVSAFLLMR
jgi:multisubunit Na+/H+ antiporter MnhB subunit